MFWMRAPAALLDTDEQKKYTLEDAYAQLQDLLDQCGNTKDTKAFTFIKNYIEELYNEF